MKHKLLWTMALTLLVSGAAAAQDAETFVFGDPLPDAPELAARGDYSVGVRTLELVDEGRIDLFSLSEENPTATYDRPLTVEMWYPAELGDDGEETVEYEDNLGRADDEGSLTPFTFAGRAARDAAVDASDGPYPLVIVSHGFPGSRYMMTYLAENIASKGYVVAAIAHTDSVFTDVFNTQAGFGSTLLNRAADQEFVLDEMAAFGESDANFEGVIDADNTAVIGYSMGGYGALNAVGAGYNETLGGFLGPVAESRLASNPDFLDARDERIKAAVLFAPFGGDLAVLGIPGVSFWDADALASITVPTLWIVGSEDDVAIASGVIGLFDGAVNSERWLLTYEGALHNVAPNPPPADAVDFPDYERYSEPVWEEARINNINQHFVTAFLATVLGGDESSADYLNVAVENADEGVFAVDEAGAPTEENTYWLGFQNRTAVGMSLRHELP